MTKSIDIKLVNFVRRICNYYLRKRKFLVDQKSVETPDKIQLHIIPYIASGSLINYIDIGAHKGYIVDELSKHFTLDKVILVEPIEYLAAFLKNKYSTKGYNIYQNVISDIQCERIDFNINELSETSSLLEFEANMKELSDINTKLDEIQKISSRTLDDIFIECKFTKVDILKIDVQGAEHLVIKGAHKSLEKTRFIWIELSFKPLYKKSSVFSDIYSQLQKENFILLEVSEGHRGPNKELLQIDALFVNSKFIN